MARPIAEIAVAGGGRVGWSTAAALKRRLPFLKVTLVEIPPPADALADRLISALPSIGTFHADIGLTEADTIARAGSELRVGTWFEDWAQGEPAYVHAYGPYGQPFGTLSFHHLWLRAARDGAVDPFDRFAPSAELGRNGGPIDGKAADGIAVGLQLNPARYDEMMRAYARHLGVAERAAEVGEVRIRADGFIDRLQLSDGGSLAADLFVDCTGPRATLLSAIAEEYEDWGRWLPCDRVLIGHASPSGHSLLDHSVAVPTGWRWRVPASSETSHGLVYSSTFGADAAARAMLQDAGATGIEEPIAIRQGRRAEPWVRNCVAVGDAAVLIDPLEWTNLHLAHSAIDRIIAMMPDSECAPVELKEYNRQCGEEADRIRDFVCLHYVTAKRPGEPFWDQADSFELPDSLAHTLGLFEERGRLPFHEEETFARDSWLAVLLGQGVRPRRIDPLTDMVPADQARATLARLRGLTTSAAQQPKEHTYMQQYLERVSR